jgi:clavulanate-9-aldehyde reductase
MKLENRTALVTGATSGIGREAARALAREGASVAIAGRRVERLEELAEEIRGAGGEVIELPGDVTDPESTASWVEETVETLGGLDVLVNSAGIIATGGLRDTSDETWTRMMDVNFWGLMQLSRAVIGPMEDRGGGSIVNVSSVCSYRPFPGVTAYCVSKAAVDMLTQCLSLELAESGIRVNAVNPGVVVSELQLVLEQARCAPCSRWRARCVARAHRPLSPAGRGQAGWIVRPLWSAALLPAGAPCSDRARVT